MKEEGRRGDGRSSETYFSGGMLHIPAAKLKEMYMRSKSERGNRKMNEVQGWRSKQVNYKKEEETVCGNQRGDGAQGMKEQPKCSQGRDVAGVRKTGKKRNFR